MMHTIIVPGVGGSEHDHWQSWLQRQLMSCSRVQQQDWHQPILKKWVAQWLKTVQQVHAPIQVVAHSFGCLTSVAALDQYPEVCKKVKKLILVAPANPARFTDIGFSINDMNNYQAYFHQIKLKVATDLLISENDPWLSFEDAKKLAHAWQVRPRNLGQVGHINVASGFGPFPEIYDHLIPETTAPQRVYSDESEGFFKFAI